MATTGKDPKGTSRRSTSFAVLMVVAAGAIAWFGYQPAEPHAAARTVAGQSITLPAEGTSGPAVASSRGLPTRIRVASAGIDSRVAEVGVVNDGAWPRWETTWRAAGHHIDSSLPGHPGNIVITGHVAVAAPGNLPVFARLGKVTVGDAVEVFSGDRVYQYRVDEVVVVEPDVIEMLQGDHRSTVTLITGTPDLKNRPVVVGSLLS